MKRRGSALIGCLIGLVSCLALADEQGAPIPVFDGAVETMGTARIDLLLDGDDSGDESVPPLPASPAERFAASDYLPPLDQELRRHGGSYLYESIDEIRDRHEYLNEHPPAVYLPESWEEPQPISLPLKFLGPGRIPRKGWMRWPHGGPMWEPRFTTYGSYELFGVGFEEDGQRRDGIGHQLIVDLDFEFTGTERIHVQFRPLGEENTGGSFWQLNDPSGYIDNSTGVPQRWWFEGELQSLFGGWIDDPTIQLDTNITVGKFPFALHNALLINDEITGIVLAKNTITKTPLSNINVQVFYSFDDVDVDYGNTETGGVHVLADYRHALIEATYAHLFDSATGADRSADYTALSVTQFFGPLTLAGRVLAKFGDEDGTGDGQLYVLESNHTRSAPDWLHEYTGIELAVSYINLFKATSGWSPISGGNYNRLINLFTLNPLLNIAAGLQQDDTIGAAAGVQFFCHHQDATITPEIAIEEVSADTVWGVSLRGRRKLTARTFLEVRGLRTFSSVSELEREGVFGSLIVIF